MLANQDTSSLSAVKLAALASSLMPELSIVAAQELKHPFRHMRMSIITLDEADGNKKLLTLTPSSESCREDFVKEITNLKMLENRIPLPKLLAFVDNFAIMEMLHGQGLKIQVLNKPQVKSLAVYLAKLHSLDVDFANATAIEIVDSSLQHQRLTTQLDEAALTGKVPSSLLDRFELFLISEANWNYDAVTINGSINASSLLFVDDELSSIMYFNNMMFSDPALDLMRILPRLSADLVEVFVDTYTRVRKKMVPLAKVDAKLSDRAFFYANFALVQRLLKENKADNVEKVNILTQKLEQLDKKLNLEDRLEEVETQRDSTKAAIEQEKLKRELQNDLPTEQITSLQAAKMVDEHKGAAQDAQTTLVSVEDELEMMLTNESGKIDLRHQPDTKSPTSPSATPEKNSLNDSVDIKFEKPQGRHFSFQEYTGEVKKG
ncbi:MAG: hypothetical protein LBQ41_00815 [Candidatus Ancillula sp.]|jgi:hypothetical protein|nr:hypothetical protein [Candidatus Ancillula sp.]